MGWRGERWGVNLPRDVVLRRVASQGQPFSFLWFLVILYLEVHYIYYMEGNENEY